MKLARELKRVYPFVFSFLPVLVLSASCARAQSGAGSPESQPAAAAAPAQPVQPGQTSQQQTPQSPQEESAHHSIFSRSTGNVQPGQPYERPSQKVKFHNYLFDTLGPYPFIGSAFAAGLSQAYGTPPEWGQGWDSYGVRVANYFGINMITTTTRYGLAEAFHEDSLYYRCECRGFFPRFGHALISTVTARRGDDGHRVFSFPALAAPYAGSMTAVSAWYPSRYELMDGFRIGNYNLLYQAAENVALEFLYGGPHTLLSHMPLSSLTGSSSSKSKN